MNTLPRAREISLKVISGLRPDFGARVRMWYEFCWRDMIPVYIYEGYRSNERQEELFAQGRTTPGKIVTKARAGQSFHNYGRAIDWAPIIGIPGTNPALFDPDWKATGFYAAGKSIIDRFLLRDVSWEHPHLEDATFEDWRELADTVALS